MHFNYSFSIKFYTHSSNLPLITFQEKTRDILDSISKDFNVNKREDWYRIRATDIMTKQSGKNRSFLNKYYGGSLVRALRAAYPEFPWKSWKFCYTPPNFWNDVKNQIIFFEDLKQELGLEKDEEWYGIQPTEITSFKGGEEILELYGGSLFKALRSCYPTQNWCIWKFDKFEEGIWHDKKNQREFFEWLSKDMNLRKPTDWHQVTLKDVIERGGRRLMRRYFEHSLPLALQSIYPEYKWKLWKFEKVSYTFWKDITHQKEFLEDLSECLGLTKLDDWYQVTHSNIFDHFGSGLLAEYGGSLLRALRTVYPAHNWQLTKFPRYAKGPWQYVQKDFWGDMQHYLEYFHKIAKERGIHNPEDWYGIVQNDVWAQGVNPVAKKYFGSSLFRALSAFHISHQWKAEQAPHGFWQDISNQRAYLDWISQDLKIQKPEDWYSVKTSEVYALGGSGLLGVNYKGSLVNALLDIFPEYHWVIWRFGRVPRGFWDDEEHVLAYLHWLADQLNIRSHEDWYAITNQQVAALRGPSLIIRNGGLIPVLAKYFPQHNWQLPSLANNNNPNTKKSLISIGKTQMYLWNITQKLFPSSPT